MKSARLPGIAILFALSLAVAACSGDDAASDKSAGAPAEGEESATGAEGDTEVHTYTVRGRVEVLPTEEQERIQLFHEEVPDFVNRQGEVAGMAAMSMPFGVADGVALEGIEEGDIVEFTFEADFDHPDVSRVTAIEALPEDTELDLD